MKIVLLNDNPVVSRLISIGLSKLGYEFSEVEDIAGIGDIDLLICDSALMSENFNYESLAKSVVYLVPKNYIKQDNQKHLLQKPFLPTDFIGIVEEIISTMDTKEDKTASVDEFTDISDTFEDIENLDFDIDNIKDMDTNDNADEKIDDSALSGGDDGDLNELSNMVHEIDEMSDEIDDYEDLNKEDLNKMDNDNLAQGLDDISEAEIKQALGMQEAADIAVNVDLDALKDKISKQVTAQIETLISKNALDGIKISVNVNLEKKG